MSQSSVSFSSTDRVRAACSSSSSSNTTTTGTSLALALVAFLVVLGFFALAVPAAEEAMLFFPVIFYHLE